jgi:hypothetical protein
MRGRTLTVGFLVQVALSAGTQGSPSLPTLLDLLHGEWKAKPAMEYMRRVYATDRYFTFPKFAATAQYLESTMRQIGLTQVEIVNAPADGKTQVGYWTEPMAWDVKSATLELLDRSIPAKQRMLADYAAVPASLGMWSGSTPSGGVVAEIVEAEAAELQKKDLRGKLVLTNVNPAGIKYALVKAGALGAINTFTENPGLPNGRQWINAWGDDGWAYTARSTPLLSFSISPDQARFVRQKLKLGPVRVRAIVDAHYYAGDYPYVTGVIAGTSREEVLTLGHTSEQGAQDNATGVAATLEALATLQRLIDAGKLARPARSIRILSMPEMYGSMHYVQQNRERIRRTVAAMCVDTPAASYALSGTEYTFYMNPHVAKDFTDAFILKVAQTHLTSVHRPWHEREFTTGTDTYMAEPMVGVPTVWGYSGSGVETHHNSEDTPDRVDERSLRDISIIDAAFLYYIANAGEAEAQWLSQLSETRGYSEIAKRAAKVLDGFALATDTAQLSAELSSALDQIMYAVGREQQAVSSVKRLVGSNVFDAGIPSARLAGFGVQQLARIREAAEDRARELGGRAVEVRTKPDPLLERIIVRRKRFGTIPLDDLPHDRWEGFPSGAWASTPTVALYWCDGRRNLAEVIRLTQLELGPSKFDFAGYFRFLEKHGYVEFVPQE